jgi:AcrR family transcriptional regulator
VSDNIDSQHCQVRRSTDGKKKKILEAAVHLAVDKGYQNIERAEIAGLARVSPGLVAYYFDDMERLKRTVLLYAIHNENLAIVAQGLAVNDELVKKYASIELCESAAAALVKEE